MNELISGIKKAAIYDNATKTVVQLNNIATDAVYNDENSEVELAGGTMKFAGIDKSLELKSYDDDGFTQLDTWMKNQTPVRVVCYGTEENIIWHEDALITVKKDYQFQVGSLNGFTVKIAFKGISTAVKTVSNLVLAQSLFVDANLDGEVDCLSFPKGYDYIPTFSADKQTLESGGAENVVIENKIDFPIAGANIASSFESDLNENTINSVLLLALDKDDNILSQVSLVAGLATLTTPSNTYYIKYQIDITFGTTGNQTRFSVPAGVNY